MKKILRGFSFEDTHLLPGALLAPVAKLHRLHVLRRLIGHRPWPRACLIDLIGRLRVEGMRGVSYHVSKKGAYVESRGITNGQITREGKSASTKSTRRARFRGPSDDVQSHRYGWKVRYTRGDAVRGVKPATHSRRRPRRAPPPSSTAPFPNRKKNQKRSAVCASVRPRRSRGAGRGTCRDDVRDNIASNTTLG